MADISRELQDILDAVYGEEVRDSIHDAIALINDVGEVALTLGTDVTSESSSIEGYYDGSVYINTTTYIMWVCDGTAWVNKGSLKGADGENGADGASLTATSEKVGKITTVTISNAVTGAVVNTFTVSDGKDGTGGGGGVSDWADLENKPFESVGTGLKTDGGVLALSSEVSAQIVNLDSNGKISASNVLDTDGTTAISQKLSKLEDDGTLDYTNVINTPTIPTVEQTYSSSSANAMSGVAVAEALENVSFDKSIISDAYSASTSYSVGDYCIYNDMLWKKIGTTEIGVIPTEGTSWTESSVSEELTSANTIIMPNYTDVVRIGGDAGNVNYSLNANDTRDVTAIAPKDGYVYCYSNMTSGISGTVQIDGETVSNYKITEGSKLNYEYSTPIFFVKKGASITLSVKNWNSTAVKVYIQKINQIGIQKYTPTIE